MASKYDPKFCDLLISHMKKGGSFLGFGGVIGVGRRTLYDWTAQYKEFSDAKDIAECASLNYHEEIGHGIITGQIPKASAIAWMFTMKCRFSKFGYSDIQNALDDEDAAGDSLEKLPSAKLLSIVKNGRK